MFNLRVPVVVRVPSFVVLRPILTPRNVLSAGTNSHAGMKTLLSYRPIIRYCHGIISERAYTPRVSMTRFTRALSMLQALCALQYLCPSLLHNLIIYHRTRSFQRTGAQLKFRRFFPIRISR